MDEIKLSISIVSHNEGERIGRTLDAIKDIASEIILIDANSDDRTCEIAEGYGVKIFKEDWKGHIEQKNSALDKCSGDWILCIDCDEVVSDELKNEVVGVLEDPKADGYLINRKTFYLGRFLNFAWQPDWKLRLVRKASAPKWGGVNPHDVLNVEGETEKLSGYLYHYSYKDRKHHFDSTRKYAKISADAYRSKGKKANILNLIFNPGLKFLRSYILRLGILDGYRGLLVGISAYYYTHLKYAYLLGIKKGAMETGKKTK